MIKCECVTLFQIVPVNDGYHYMCKNAEGYYLNRKEESGTVDDLIFETEQIAQKYINRYSSSFNLNYCWKPEDILYNVKYIPTEVIKEVK
jgi:hypothetical protein